MLEGVVPQDYEVLCKKWSDDDDTLSAWRELRLALGGRAGWWFLDPRFLSGYDGGPVWCFGDAAEPRLCLSPLDAGFGLYIADTDEELMFDDVTQVVEWLDANQSDHEGLSPVLDQLMSDRFAPMSERRPPT
jgi:hypothetical protein